MVAFTEAIFGLWTMQQKFVTSSRFLNRKKKNSGKILALTIDVLILNVLLDSTSHCTLTSLCTLYPAVLILFSRWRRGKGVFYAVAPLVYARLKLAPLVILTFDRIYYS